MRQPWKYCREAGAALGLELEVHAWSVVKKLGVFISLEQSVCSVIRPVLGSAVLSTDWPVPTLAVGMCPIAACSLFFCACEMVSLSLK
jgi:hypothetical protein